MACPNASNLNAAQKDIAARIIHAGDTRGFSDQMINFALKAAFIESSMGTNMGASRPGGDHIGLFQYDAVTWSSLKHDGSRNSVDAQINAFYDDINKYTARYNALSPAERGFLSQEQYIYLKHHDGNNYKDWSASPGVKIFNSTCFNMDVKTADNGGGEGGGGGGGGIEIPPWMGWDDIEVGIRNGTVTVFDPVTVPPKEPPPGEDGDGEY